MINSHPSPLALLMQHRMPYQDTSKFKYIKLFLHIEKADRTIT